VSKPAILSTRPLFPAARTILDQHFDVDYGKPSERISREELLKRVADKEGLVCLLTEKVDDQLLSAAPKLRIASTVSVGYDNIDVAACTKHKVVATNTPGVLDDTTADFAWTLLMAIARRLLEGDAWMRSGTWPGWDQRRADIRLLQQHRTLRPGRPRLRRARRGRRVRSRWQHVA